MNNQAFGDGVHQDPSGFSSFTRSARQHPHHSLYSCLYTIEGATCLLRWRAFGAGQREDGSERMASESRQPDQLINSPEIASKHCPRPTSSLSGQKAEKQELIFTEIRKWAFWTCSALNAHFNLGNYSVSPRKKIHSILLQLIDLKRQVCFNSMNMNILCILFSIIIIIVLLYVWCYLNPHHNLWENKAILWNGKYTSIFLRLYMKVFWSLINVEKMPAINALQWLFFPKILIFFW